MVSLIPPPFPAHRALHGSSESISPPESWVLPVAITGECRASKGQQAKNDFSLPPPESLQLEFKEVEYERYDASGRIAPSAPGSSVP